jgi:hypothetical protein
VDKISYTLDEANRKESLGLDLSVREYQRESYIYRKEKCGGECTSYLIFRIADGVSE